MSPDPDRNVAHPIFSTYGLYGPTSERVWMQRKQKKW